MFGKMKKYVIGFLALCGGILIGFLSGKGAGRRDEKLGKLDIDLDSLKTILSKLEKIGI